MAKYHINPETGNANICTAKVKCKFTNSEGVEPPHYGTKLNAQKASEQQLSSTLPTIQSLKNDVEIKEPVGDPRTPNEIAHDLVRLTKTISVLSEEYKSCLTALRFALEDYDETVKHGATFDSNELAEVAQTANSVIRKTANTRKDLLTARSRLNEEHLVHEQKLHPKRASERAAILAKLQPTTRNGEEILAKMKQTFEDSERELEVSKRATDNLVNRHRNGLAEGSNSTKTSFAQVNDTIAQSDRIIQHARALKQLSELTQDYKVAEAKNLSSQVNLEPLKMTGIESLTANSQTPSQVEVYSRITDGINENQLNDRYIKLLESTRRDLPTGSAERDEINRDLKARRDRVKHNQQQYQWQVSRASNTDYKGFILLK